MRYIQPISVSRIIDFIGIKVCSVNGNYEDLFIDNLADLDHVNEKTLDWVKPSVNSQQIAENSKAKTLIVGSEISYSQKIKNDGKVLIHVDNPKQVLAIIGNKFFVDKPEPMIHPTSIIDPEAQIGFNVYIGPFCVIGKASIGDNCVIESNVQIYDDVSLGNNCYIKSGAKIGGAGFGFVEDENGKRIHFPQIGSVIIGDFVEIGSNTCIDRGALSNTIIGNNTKINNLCHIAHNTKIGNNVTITGCVNISGSTEIEDDVWIAPNSSIRGFLKIGKGSVIGMGAVVTKNVPAGELWIGNPAHKMIKQ